MAKPQTLGLNMRLMFRFRRLKGLTGANLATDLLFCIFLCCADCKEQEDFQSPGIVPSFIAL